MTTLREEWDAATPDLQQEWDAAAPSATPAPPAPTWQDRVKALQGGLYRGVAGIAGLPMDTVETAYNLVKAGVGTAATAAGRPDLAPELTRGTPLGSEWIAEKLQGLGVNTRNPRPDDMASRMLYTGGVVTGGSAFPGMRASSVIPAATGAAVAGEVSDNPLAPAVGAMLPGAVAQGARDVKAAVAAKTAPVVETFKKVGATPSIGQVTDSAFFSGLENLASKFPGGAGVMRKFIENQQRQIGSKARTGVAAENAGRAIEEGIAGKGGFIERTKGKWVELDNALAAKVPTNARFVPSNTLKALDELTTPVTGAEKSTGQPLDARITTIKQNLLDDLSANNGAMPFEAIRKIRSRVGSQIDDALVQGAKSGEMSKLYGALSSDLEAVAKQAGAGREFARQNNYYRARMDRIESVLDRVIGKGRQPEEIFKAVNPTDPDQANKLRAVMRSLEPADRKVVSDAVVNRLGRATPGQQTELGDKFSSETFLTNWNRLSPGAKAQLFADDAMRSNLDAISKAAGGIRHGKGVYADPSGTAGSFAAYAVYMGPVAALGGGLAGVPGAVASSAASAATANIGAKMLTNPKIVEWLAKPINPRQLGSAAMHLQRLAVIYNAEKDQDTRKELEAFMASLNAQNPGAREEEREHAVERQ